MTNRPNYEKALVALREAHQACFENERRDVLGMTNGPFSGVNVALGIIDELEKENRLFRSWLASSPKVMKDT